MVRSFADPMVGISRCKSKFKEDFKKVEAKELELVLHPTTVAVSPHLVCRDHIYHADGCGNAQCETV